MGLVWHWHASDLLGREADHCFHLSAELLATGERMLLRCLDQRPSCLEARMLLMDNIMAQGR